MRKYAVKLMMQFEHGDVDPQEVADFVADAVSLWGGQYRTDNDFFPTNIKKVHAQCRDSNTVVAGTSYDYLPKHKR